MKSNMDMEEILRNSEKISVDFKSVKFDYGTLRELTEVI